MILCVCKYGHSRSAAAVRLFHRYGIESVAVGWKTSPQALQELEKLAKLVVILDDGYFDLLTAPPVGIARYTIPIGEDKWRNPYDDELIELLKPHIANIVKGFPELLPKREPLGPPGWLKLQL